MKFELVEIQKVYKHDGHKPKGEWVVETKGIARREQEQVDPSYHDMKLGEHRTIVAGYELVRIE